ncbi:putative deoxyribonuclease TATDN1 [Kickxella alabastrina]|uniref:putative deoxyribonuclease TATDN1 n=1 Tax=Kickxella alabastrina TaxID=61397 RepID=UPI0022210CAE|nr:putative deoxyribonuclease TATDN1 [Kickxella alabastrina]KAI7821140.1 putative deoxyribonuclease TATDN1 [Kickxella alabastrina]
MKIIDIGANLTDPVFRGVYRGKRAHEDDMNKMIERAQSAGIVAMMVTGGNLAESKQAIKLSHEHSSFFATVGCHPTRTSEIEIDGRSADAYFSQLRELIMANSGRVVAIGECGLDYDRLQFSSKEVQNKHFYRHFELAKTTGLPMFFHDRNTEGDFARTIKKNRHQFGDGVVHSFTGTEADLRELLELNLHIGINGCSLKTEENLAVAKLVPLDRLMIETDCPYCEIRPTHASHALLPAKAENTDEWQMPESKRKERWSGECMVKSRNEPCTIRQVIQVMAKLHDISEAELADHAYKNTYRVFFKNVSF